MKKKTLLSIVMVCMMILLVACSGAKEKTGSNQPELDQEALDKVKKTGFPIVDDEITIKMFTAKSATSANVDWNDLLVWNTYRDLTNVKIDWVEQVTGDSLNEKRNLAISGGNLPDAFFASSLSNLDLYKYGSRGLFLELNDLIDEYAPNLKKIMEEDPNVKKGMVFPDGKIYSMPGLRDPNFLSIRIGARPWINTNYLEKLKMDVPETTEEFYEFLKAVKGQDFGNGEIVPYGGVNINDLVGWLRGAYGLGNTGASGLVDKDPNGDGLRFIPTSDEYKQLLEYIHKLYSEKLIEQNIFSIEWAQFMANASEGKYASTMFYDPQRTYRGVEADNYTSMSALKGPNGDQFYTNISSPIFNNGQFVITKNNPNPAATVRWMDYFYSDEGAKLMYMGVENETFIEEDGKYKYVDKIENGEHRETEISKYIPWVGINPPGIVKAEYFSGSESSEKSLEAAEKIEPYIPSEIWSTFIYTDEESKFLSASGEDIQKYVNEMRDKFISGDESLDNWDHYVSEIEKMGLEKYMEIQKAAYDRYQSQ
ncbi:extracellular solute-binding protein [Lederbergia wuyishanensis]|uniref:Aldouronate transport system substrate-binding protein n=1 Tax=Lederbergia wuyishanensis TaxID=1347903 RepID=A0ABU0D5J1_9BACI|nr:extracellular solute-binding protein [Lederbergia wuyishanensis]MCJ8009821.1 extracellular solute-binding protein [Lederbergia wuyishanensis]MDQ0343677.1 putative aldouronate transport system substrate-binding protein [Lederbergia wuyishanensis]